jgi:hypothetical protein
MRGTGKTEHESVGIHRKLVRRTYAGSLASPDEFAKLKYLPASSYPTATKNSMDCKILRIG